MVIFFDKFNIISDEKYKLLYSFLPQTRKQKVDKTKDENSKKIQIVEYFLLKKYLGFCTVKDFSYNQFGKPYILGEKNFSISHTKNALVIAISENEIGIDIQKISKINDKIIQKTCKASEQKILQNSKNKDEQFAILWTMKESYVKLFGKSIFLDTKNILNDKNGVNFKTIKKDNYIITICTKK
jgi:4'-phosphopantetheinyl transferase